MPASPDADALIYGTSTADAEPEWIDIGPWRLEFRDGALTSVRLDGAEVARGIGFVARDENWGSPSPRVSGQRVERTSEVVTIDYDAEVSVGGSKVVYTCHLRAAASGELVFRVAGRAHGAIRTNRIGFVVLHPITGIAGQPLAVTHADGEIEDSVFPLAISAAQPVFDIVALEHALPGGARVRIAFEGGTWEMEDQRNWSDASYKTYYRSLFEPFPYEIADGEVLEQQVTVTRLAAGRVGAGGDAPCRVGLGAALDAEVPVMALALHGDRPQPAALVRETLESLPGARAQIWLDLVGDGGARALEHARSAHAAGAEVALEVLFPDTVAAKPTLDEVARSLAGSGVRVASAVGVPRAFLASYQPTDRWPEGLQPEQVTGLLRAALPDARIGYGMLTYFTEFNRRRPPAHGHDFVNHGTCAIVHAADDRSVMQTLEALDPIAASVREMTAAGVGYHLGPCLIGMRSNPYGASTMDNPERRRCPMALADPRQAGLFAAAFALGVAAAVSAHRVDQLTLAEVAGPLGVRPGAPAPAPGTALHPVYHVVRGLARGARCPLMGVSVSEPARVAGLAWRAAQGTEMWLANLGPEPVVLAFDARPGDASAVLDIDSLAGGGDPALLDALVDGVPERLGPYAVARVMRP